MRGHGAGWIVRLRRTRTLCVVKSYSGGCVDASIMSIHSWMQIGCCLGSGLADSTVDFSCTPPPFLPQSPCKIDLKSAYCGRTIQFLAIHEAQALDNS